MSRNCVRWHCNWPHVCSFGDEIIQSVNVPADESYLKFYSLPVAEIIHETKSALFVRPEELLSTEFNKCRNCEFSLEMLDTYKLRAISLICNVNKLEIFEGPLKSYRETIYGVVIEKDNEDLEGLIQEGRDEVDAVLVNTGVTEDKTNNHLPSTKCYRYDIDASSIGITALDIRFITNQNEICIFGIRIYYSQLDLSLSNDFQNLNLSSKFPINMINVRKLLEESFRRPSSQQTAKSEARLHQFLDAIEKSVEIPYLHTQNNNVEQQSKKEHNNKEEESLETITLKEDLIESKKTFNLLRDYLDNRLEEMEKRLIQRIDKLEECQTNKLNKILEILKSKSSDKELLK